MTTPIQIWDLCESCAGAIYGDRMPTPAYANSVARMLLGTAAQETWFTAHRQGGPEFWGTVGGFGLWQCEQGSIGDSLLWLQARPLVAARATRFLYQDSRAEKDLTWLKGGVAIANVLWALRLSDCNRLGVLMARLHYLRVPEAIPESAAGQAAYWLDHYNCGGVLKTFKTGTPEERREQAISQYLTNWNRLCLPVIARDE